MLALGRGLFDRAVHSFDLTVVPRMAWLGEAVFDVEVGANQFKGTAAKGKILWSHCIDVFLRPAVAGWVGEVRFHSR